MLKRSITFIPNWSDKHFLCILKIKWSNEQSLENNLFILNMYLAMKRVLPNLRTVWKVILSICWDLKWNLHHRKPTLGVVWMRWPGPVIISFTTKWSSWSCYEFASIKQKKQQPTHSATSWNIGGGPDVISIIGKRSHFKSLICKWQDLEEPIYGRVVFRNPQCRNIQMWYKNFKSFLLGGHGIWSLTNGFHNALRGLSCHL